MPPEVSPPSRPGLYPGDPSGPLQFDRFEWWDVVKRVYEQLACDNLSLVSAGVAFYGLLSLFPAMAGAVSIYGLASDPMDVVNVAKELHGILPRDVRNFIVEQLQVITSASGSALSLGAMVGLALSIWSSNNATKALFTGLNIAYGEREKRSFIRLNVTSLIGTTCFLCAVVAVFFAMTFLPDTTEYGPFLSRAISAGVLLILATGMQLTISILYKIGPSRARAQWRWVTVGATTATVLWLTISVLFSLYVEYFGSFNETFGAVGGVAMMMTWIWLSSYAVLLGAEINAELERTTRRDSTTGPPEPLGERGAVVADDYLDWQKPVEVPEEKDDLGLPITG